MTQALLSRRFFLKSAALIGCSAAAHPFMSSVTLASAPWEERLVVIILRGAMDGLAVLQPLGDPSYAGLRPDLGAGLAGGAMDLDGFYALHPNLSGLMPMWRAGELGFIHAVSTPYRDKRSHFDGQDLLEAGTGFDLGVSSIRDGWLNRLLQVVPGVVGETAFAIGHDAMKVLQGEARYTVWSPTTSLALSAQSRLLLEAIYHDDPLFRDAGMAAMDLAEELAREQASPEGQMMANETEAEVMQAVKAADPKGKPDPLASFAATRLNQDTRIAAFSLSGWDTHRDQPKALLKSLTSLQNTLLTLKSGLGDNWRKTTVLAMTEFGRTARQNGSKGTDHGTGGAMLLAGGAVRGGKAYGKWPGLAEADLYDRRDLMPTSDVRAHAAWAMHRMFGLDRKVLEGSIFPGLDMGEDAGLIL